MNEKKQIEEIKNILIKTCKRVRNSQEDYMQDRYAEALYKEGYRKQIEGEWIFHNDGSGTCKNCNTHQTHIWDMDNYQSYCGHCGAKMKGE